MTKKIFETSPNFMIPMYGYMGEKPGDNLSIGVKQWQDYFTKGCHFAEEGYPDTYDTIWFLRNTNFQPYFEETEGIWTPDRSLPIFHAAAVFVGQNRPRQIYLFNYSQDLDTMLQNYPYAEMVLEDGRSYLEVMRRRHVQVLTKDYGETPLYPSGWGRNIHKFDGFDLISMLYWQSWAMRDDFTYDRSAKVLRTIEQTVAPQRTLSEKVTPLTLPSRYQYIFELPDEMAVHIYHVAVFYETEMRAILLIQNDAIPAE